MFTESPRLEGTHGDHWVQPLVPPWITQNQTLCLRVVFERPLNSGKSGFFGRLSNIFVSPNIMEPKPAHWSLSCGSTSTEEWGNPFPQPVCAITYILCISLSAIQVLNFPINIKGQNKKNIFLSVWLSSCTLLKEENNQMSVPTFKGRPIYGSLITPTVMPLF